MMPRVKEIKRRRREKVEYRPSQKKWTKKGGITTKKRENILFVYLRRLAPDYVGVVIFRLASRLFSSKHDRFGILAGTITASFS